MDNTKQTTKTVIGVLVIAVVAAVLYGVATMPDQRTTGQRVGDAIDALPQGVDKAAQKLEKRSPGEKFGDAVKDMGDDIKSSTDDDR